jgi:hypothetical protein
MVFSNPQARRLEDVTDFKLNLIPVPFSVSLLGCWKSLSEWEYVVVMDAPGMQEWSVRCVCDSHM